MLLFFLYEQTKNFTLLNMLHGKVLKEKAYILAYVKKPSAEKLNFVATVTPLKEVDRWVVTVSTKYYCSS